MRIPAVTLALAALVIAITAHAGEPVSASLNCSGANKPNLSTKDVLHAISSVSTAEGLMRPDGRPQGQVFWARRSFSDVKKRDGSFQRIKERLTCFGFKPAYVDEAFPQNERGGSLVRYRVESYKLEDQHGPSISLGTFDDNERDTRAFMVDVQFYYLR
jgi:hypothetical protein